MTMSTQSTVNLAEYLFARIRQLGVQSVFGVPGDYNLNLLDFVEPSGSHWVGNCNELNAAYAADGYARINGLSALITTFGVGELSAINAIAGAYAERAPVVHIVGTPLRQHQDARVVVHHTFLDADYRRFANMASHVTVAQVNLRDPSTAPEQVDWALQQALLHSRPVYIEVPDDMVRVQVSAANLESKSISLPPIVRNPHESQVLAQILDRFYAAKQPLILVDGETRAFGVVDQVQNLSKSTNWPTWTTIFGKSLLNEQLPNVYGVYEGAFGSEQHKAYFDSADLILHFGPHISDTNTMVYTTIPNQAVTVSFLQSAIQTSNGIHRDISRDFLTNLLEQVDWARIAKPSLPSKTATAGEAEKKPEQNELITQKDFWSATNPFLREGDLVLAETGTASYGARMFNLPANTRFFGAVTWLSIGYMLPATLGAALARRDRTQNPRSRAILFIGDGSLQMTAQEISTIIAEKLNVIIIVLNNDGYTIERVIHGRKQKYNGVARWNYTSALAFFGMDEAQASKNTFQARTWAELEGVMRNPQVQDGEGARIVEVFMDREDVQGVLLRVLQKQIAEEQ